MPEWIAEPERRYSAYTARGFSPELDAAIAATKVAEPDLAQSLGMVRVCAATEQAIYEGSFSPRRISYRRGSRPVLELAAGTSAVKPGTETAIAMMNWVHKKIRHAWTCDEAISPVRGLTEEQIIASGAGWCNEQARVFIALCEIHDLPARLCFVFHQSHAFGHAAAEVFLEGHWGFFDPTFDLCVILPEGRAAEGRELAGAWRTLAHDAYRSAYDRFLPKLAAKWQAHFLRTHDSDPAKPGDLLAFQGITNYVIHGVQSLDGAFHQPTTSPSHP